MNQDFEILILSRNRPEFLEMTLRSWLEQDLSNTRLLVSDNSTDERVSLMLSDQFPQIEVRRRRPPLSSEEHFKICRSEVQGAWFMLFHDDDVMLPGGWLHLKSAALSHPQIVAVAANARFLRGTELTRQIYNPRVQRDRLLTAPAQLAEAYCYPVSFHHPFPAYLYRTAGLQGLTFDNREARKFSDTTFLMRMSALGPILWLGQAAMAYRTHGESDSSAHDMIAATLLRRSFTGLGNLPKDSLPVRSFRAWNYLLHLRQLRRSSQLDWSRPRQRQILCYVIKHYLFHPLQITAKIFQLLRRKLRGY